LPSSDAVVDLSLSVRGDCCKVNYRRIAAKQAAAAWSQLPNSAAVREYKARGGRTCH